MKREDVTFYADLFKEMDLTELTVEENESGTRFSMKRTPAPLPFPAAGPGPVPGAAPAPKAGATPAKPAGSAEDGFDKIAAPLLGMFHEAEPAVKPGTVVRKGDTLCVIEAMKMMNDIPSPRDGIIKKVCAAENEIVEYGQTLFLIGD